MCREVIVRDLSSEDVEAVVPIAVDAWEPVYEGFRRQLGDRLFELAHADWRDTKSLEIRTVCDPESPGVVLVAQVAGRVVGFVSFFVRNAGIGVIGNNAVHPEFQNRGIATRLYEQALDRIRPQGVRYVRVLTGDDAAHAPARRAYEKAGFERKLPTVTYWRKL